MDRRRQAAGIMIRVERTTEPPNFDEDVRKPGMRWLAEHDPSKKRPPSYWREVHLPLRKAFHHRCAYTAMVVSGGGTVDHFVSVKEARESGSSELIYEWSNYRFADSSINSSKQDLRSSMLLDPFNIEDDWFEVQLPSCQLRVTELCPASHRERASFMLDRFRLNSERWVDIRRVWLDCYEKSPDIAWLETVAPMLARAVRKQEEQAKS